MKSRIAPEGSYELPLRLAGLIEHKIAPGLAGPELFDVADHIDLRHMPFAWTGGCPPLLEKSSLPWLVDKASAAQHRFEQIFKLDLVAVFFDTVAAAAGWKDENDNAQAQAVMNQLRALSEQTGAFVLAADHFGKDSSTGTRGASAKEAAADVVLATLGDRKDDGTVADTRLAIRKLRAGPSGLVLPFKGKVVSMGKSRSEVWNADARCSR